MDDLQRSYKEVSRRDGKKVALDKYDYLHCPLRARITHALVSVGRQSVPLLTLG